MGQYNPNPGAEINPEVKEKQMISMLTNSVYYFIQDVFILKIKDKYRLVALHQRKVLMDKCYPTERGCRMAFQYFFKDKALSEDVKANWSQFYNPDKRWLEKRCKYLEW
jgi:hypothetical protein